MSALPRLDSHQAVGRQVADQAGKVARQGFGVTAGEPAAKIAVSSPNGGGCSSSRQRAVPVGLRWKITASSANLEPARPAPVQPSVRPRATTAPQCSASALRSRNAWGLTGWWKITSARPPNERLITAQMWLPISMSPHQP